MTGHEKKLNVFLDERQVAHIILEKDELIWIYNENWQKTGYALSPHLPLDNNIPPLNTQRFLRNLLPEGAPLEVLLSSFHMSKFNTFGLIQALGLDIPGSLIISPPEQRIPQPTYFQPITPDEIEERLNQHNSYDLIIWDGKPRLSVAGVQDKINIMVNERGQLGFGEGQLCSTHILKFEKQKLSHLVLNEHLSLQLAKCCGLNVANTQIMRLGQHTALLVERFDRILAVDKVKRRHLIDGCQALNLPPEYKYEQNFGNSRDVAHIRDGASLVKLFHFSNECLNPARTKQQILDWVLFNILIFNCDAHGKNISFFVGAHGTTLAPFYDLVNIKMYSEFEHNLAMAIGDEFDENCINAYQLADFAESCQLSRALVAHRLESLIKTLIIALPLEIKQIPPQKDEAQFLQKYQNIVIARCKHFLEQCRMIISITL